MSYKVSYKRHLGKTISYRIIGTATTVGLTIGAGLPIKWAAVVGIGELVLKPLIYFLHERAWYRWIKFGLIPEKKQVKKEPTVEKPKIEKETKPKKNPPSDKRVLNYSSNR